LQASDAAGNVLRKAYLLDANSEPAKVRSQLETGATGILSKRHTTLSNAGTVDAIFNGAAYTDFNGGVIVAHGVTGSEFLADSQTEVHYIKEVAGVMVSTLLTATTQPTQVIWGAFDSWESNGKTYLAVYGGKTQSSVSQELWILEITPGTPNPTIQWYQKTVTDAPARSSASAVYDAGYLYVIGGRSNGVVVHSTLIFDVSAPTDSVNRHIGVSKSQQERSREVLQSTRLSCTKVSAAQRSLSLVECT